MLKASITITLCIVVGLYLWKVLEDQDTVIPAGKKHGLPNINKSYCSECKALYTSRGWIEYLVVKGRGPAVLVLHGSPGGVDQALEQAKALFPPTRDPKPLVPVPEDTLTPTERLIMKMKKPPYTLIVVSRPGYLRTSLNAETATIRQQSELLGLLLDELDLDSVGVIGVAGGGAYAVDFAVSQPSRVWSLVLVGSQPFEPYSHWAISASHFISQYLPVSLYNYVYGLFEYVRKSNWTTDSKSLRMLLTSTTLFASRLKGYNNDVKQLQSLPVVPIVHLLRNVTVPTLIVQGESESEITNNSNNKKKGGDERRKVVTTTVAGVSGRNIALPYSRVASAIEAFFAKHIEFLVYPDVPDSTVISSTV